MRELPLSRYLGSVEIDFASSPPLPEVDVLLLALLGGAHVNVRRDQGVNLTGVSILGGRDERRRILELVEQGRISAQEANELLAALEEPEEGPPLRRLVACGGLPTVSRVTSAGEPSSSFRSSGSTASESLERSRVTRIFLYTAITPGLLGWAIVRAWKPSIQMNGQAVSAGTALDCKVGMAYATRAWRQTPLTGRSLSSRSPSPMFRPCWG